MFHQGNNQRADICFYLVPLYKIGYRKLVVTGDKTIKSKGPKNDW